MASPKERIIPVLVYEDIPAAHDFMVHVPDVDAHFRRAREAGAEVTRDPVDQEYGQREYEARDPEGHRWWFPTPL